MQGYIKLHRQLLDNPMFKSEPFTKGQAWITLLMLTNYKTGYIHVKNGEMIKIERGECGYSELALANIFKWSRGKVKRYIKTLENQQMIQQKKVSDRIIIKIVNYDSYQVDTTNDTTNSTTNGQQIVQQTDINNNDKNDKNEKNDKNMFNTVCINSEKNTKKIDPFSNPLIRYFKDEYFKRFNCRPYLTATERNKIFELASDIEEFKETIPVTLEKLKNIDFGFENFTPNANWLLKDSNYTAVLNGTYDKQKKKTIWEELKERHNGTT